MEIKVCGVKISNPYKVVEKGGVTKLDLVSYYYDMAEHILKHIKGRPLTAFRCHGGFSGECFFKKHPSEDSQNVNIITIDGQPYFSVSTKKQLIYQSQMGTIEFHPWGCKNDRLESPDLMVFDLDPDEGLPLASLRQATRNLKSLLDEIGLTSSLKASGGKGYHVLVKIKKPMDWEEFSSLAHQIASLAEQKWPELFTLNMRKVERKGKIFLDYLRNKKGASCVAAYSVRAREGAPISWPISWEQLDSIAPGEVNVKNYKRYLKR